MFVVTEEDAAAIRAVYEQRGEFAAALELRQRFPGITDSAQARECARIKMHDIAARHNDTDPSNSTFMMSVLVRLSLEPLVLT